tara:strand:+ start:407 stop:574 length:168 start_codon:yes stop_codon:yes gene_type:complete
MKEVDDTPVPKSESVTDLLDQLVELEEKMDELVKRVANLEARKPPQDTNPDPEWF